MSRRCGAFGYCPFSLGCAATCRHADRDDEADVAWLLCSGVTGRIPPLEFAEKAPAPGDEVLVLGYPTGMRALLARAERTFVERVLTGGGADFWSIAEQLAGGGHITPLASRGIVGQVTSAAVVYDAETTQGGSGGPVLDLNGRVVAVNAAILPEFGGSNLGVPAAHGRDLIAAAAAGHARLRDHKEKDRPTSRPGPLVPRDGTPRLGCSL